VVQTLDETAPAPHPKRHVWWRLRQRR